MKQKNSPTSHSKLTL